MKIMYQISPAQISYSCSFSISDLKLSNFERRYEVRVGSHISKRKTLFVTLGLAFLFGLYLGLDYCLCLFKDYS